MKINYTSSLIILLICVSLTSSIAQIIWTQKTNFNGGNRSGCYAFTIGSKGYVGGGANYNGAFSYPNDFWEYDLATNAWTQKATFAANTGGGATSFAIGQKGYVCAGKDASGNYLNSLWEYDQISNSWNQKTSFPGAARYTPASFVIGNYAYAGMGKNGTTYFADFYRYDASNSTWSPIADIPGALRQNGKGFTIGNFGYVVGGATDNSNYNDLYQYNPATNTWASKAPYPGNGSYAFASFTYDSMAYVGTGSLSNVAAPNTFTDIYSYNANSNTWNFFCNFPGVQRVGAMSLNINSKCYMGLGSAGVYPIIAYQSDWWELNPNASQVYLQGALSNISCYGAKNGSITINTTGGTPAYTYLWDNGSTNKNRSGLSAATYTVTVTDAAGGTASKTFIITQPNAISYTKVIKKPNCFGGNNGTITLTPADGIAPYAYSWNTSPAQTNAIATGLVAGSYTCLITDANGCAKLTSAINVTQPAQLTVTKTQTNNSATVTPNGGTSPYTYSWNTIPVQTNATATGLTAGAYTVTVKDKKQCTVSLTVTIQGSRVAGNDNNTGTIDALILPNPNKGEFILQLNAEKSQTIKYELMNSASKLIAEKNLTLEKGINHFENNYRAMPRGIYTIRLSGDGFVRNLRVVVE